MTEVVAALRAEAAGAYAGTCTNGGRGATAETGRCTFTGRGDVTPRG